jgi:hypothetical protein
MVRSPWSLYPALFGWSVLQSKFCPEYSKEEKKSLLRVNKYTMT